MKLFDQIAVALAIALAGAVPAQAQLDIELKFREKKSVNPSWDPDGERLQAIVDAAAEHWESIFPGADDDVEIRYFWLEHQPHRPFAKCVSAAADTAKILGHHRIRFYSEDCNGNPLAWFVDDTPESHTEFWMTSETYGTSASASGFVGTPSELFEVGCSGSARASETAAANGNDLLSTALHEIGHALGVTKSNSQDDVFAVSAAL